MFPGLFGMVGGLLVAPLAGSVDRNNKDEGTISLLEGRSPRGERG